LGSFSIWHWIIVGAVALLLFGGKGKISDIMGDVAKGIKSFKKGLSDDEGGEAARPPETPVRSIDHQLPAPEASKISETHKVG
jgi:sec-independent protein translocase protein TatA